MTLKELQNMIKEEFDAYMGEQEDDVDVSVSDNDVDAEMGAQVNASALLADEHNPSLQQGQDESAPASEPPATHAATDFVKYDPCGNWGEHLRLKNHLIVVIPNIVLFRLQTLSQCVFQNEIPLYLQHKTLFFDLKQIDHL